jgi:glucose dehydrogenase
MQVYPENNQSRSPRHILRLQGEIELEFSDANRVGLSADPVAKDPFGDPYPELTFGFSTRDQLMLEKTRQEILGIFQRLGFKDNQLTESTVRTWGHHHLGTVRMGNDPTTSVVDADLRVHGLNNLYVSTSGAFVTGGAVNPTLTIVALTHRLAAHLQGQLAGGSHQISSTG